MFLVHTNTFKGNYFSKIDSKIAVIIYLGKSGLIGEKKQAFSGFQFRVEKDRSIQLNLLKSANKIASLKESTP